MKLEGPAWNEARNTVQKATKETKFLPGLLEEGDDAEAALRKAEAALKAKEKEIGDTEAKTVDTNTKLTAGREKLASTMDQITTIDKNVDGNKKTMASNTARIDTIDGEIAKLEKEVWDGSPGQLEPAGSGNTITVSKPNIDKINALKAERAKLVAANAALAAENDRLAKEKVPLVATRDDLQKNVIPPLEEEAKQLTALHEKQVAEKWPLLADKNTKSDKNNDIRKEIETQEKMIAQMDEDAVERIRQYEENVAAEPRPGPNFLEYGKSVWA